MFLTFEFCFVDALRRRARTLFLRSAASMTAAARAVAPSKTARSAVVLGAVRRLGLVVDRGERVDAEVGVDRGEAQGSVAHVVVGPVRSLRARHLGR